MGKNRRYMVVATIEIARFVIIPVFTAPASCLATNRMVQYGSTPASNVKYVDTSVMLNHSPYSGFVIARAIISWKMIPVATLSILVAKTIKPVYRSLISFSVKASPGNAR